MTDSYPNYKAGWVHGEICAALEKFSQDVVDEKSPRLMIFMPPRHGKSFLVSERFPVWHLGRNPHHQVLLTSYGQTLSDKFSKRARTLAKSELIEKTFPDLMLDPEKQSIQEWETTAGGAYRSVGIGGGATGTGCDILIIDDPIKNAVDANSKAKRESDWEWYQTTAYTRLMPGAGILIIETRWHEDDLAGRLITSMNDGDGDNWEILIYPALAEVDDERRKIGDALHPQRYDGPKLRKIQRAIGVRAWNSLYQQRPSVAEGTIFKRHWWKMYTDTPKRFERIVESWDCNFKGGMGNDFVVGFVVGKIGADYYLIDRERSQWDFIETIDGVRKLAAKWQNARPILIEDTANGPAVISSLKGKIGGIVAIQPLGSKEARAVTVTPIAEAGNIHIPENALWKEEFIDEAASFPKGVHDDQVDSMTQAIIYLEDEGRLSVFSNISEVFGNASIYPDSDWVAESENLKEVFIGAKWGMGAPHQHTFYAIGLDGRTVGYQRIETGNHNYALESLKGFARKLSKVAQPTVFYEASGYGETMTKLIEADTVMDWRMVPIRLNPIEIDTMVAFLKMSMDEGKISLRPWSVLFDQMCGFRCEETDKGTLVYGPPNGLSSNAVFALILAHESWKKYSGEISIAVINDIERTLARIYYGSGDFSEFE